MAVERFPIESGHILMFARAIGDTNPVYADPEKAVAPPTFVQASAQFDPDYMLRPHPGRAWMGSGGSPIQAAARAAASGGGGGAPGGGGMARGLHAEQHYTYHRPLRPGDVLSATSRSGESWEKEGRRGGKLRFNESFTDYHDQHGELVVTARSVGVSTERAPE